MLKKIRFVVCLWLLFLISCSTLDQYLVDEQAIIDNEIVIIGDDFQALYAAYLLKKNKIPYRLFTESPSLKPDLLTENGLEWGYHLFSEKDEKTLSLVKEFDLHQELIPSKMCLKSEQNKYIGKSDEKKNKFKTKSNSNYSNSHIKNKKQICWTVKEGVQEIHNELLSRIEGVLPRKQIKMHHSLVSIRKTLPYFELVFEFRNPLNSETHEKVFRAKHVILSKDWSSLTELRNINSIKKYGLLSKNNLLIESAIEYQINIDKTYLSSAYKYDIEKLKIVLNRIFNLNDIFFKAVVYEKYLSLNLNFKKDNSFQNLDNLNQLLSYILNSDYKIKGENIRIFPHYYLKNNNIEENKNLLSEIKSFVEEQGDQRLYFINSSVYTHLFSQNDAHQIDLTEKSPLEEKILAIEEVVSRIKMDNFQ